MARASPCSWRSVHGIQTVKSLALETNRQREWERRAAATVRMQFGVGRISAVADAIVQSLQTAMTVAIVAVGALRRVRGTSSRWER